ncbi:hypothetical protein A8950_2606 [Dongia mobilis]|uniref:Uncharacterized protein n=1 Tax=Dongia mobilis TaxID=578943 RepID=A0A4R6WRW1_9PROT|nr:hypothetical protein [Dongia mobilis]TDQ81537.1 hypothetical protein A8950_2606 [Dongia mobilis]
MTRILGIDFSGASDAGARIWIAAGRREDGPLSVTDCRPAMQLPGGARAPGIALSALRTHVLTDADTIAGCDFPFSLPADLVAAKDWRRFALDFINRYPTPRDFHDLCHVATGGVETKRRTDREDRTPFNSFNLRLYRQTWWGIGHLLAPLVAAGQAAVWPQMPKRAGRPLLIEVCAACSLIRLDHYPSYKGTTPAHRKARAGILDLLVASHWLAGPKRSLRASLLDNTGGDALDAVIGAVAVNRALALGHLDRKPDKIDRIEGRVFYTL